MPDSGKLLLELFLMFSSGKLLAEVCERLRQPAVLGEILAGVLLGPSALALIHPTEMTRGLAEIEPYSFFSRSDLRPSRASCLRWAEPQCWWRCWESSSPSFWVLPT